MPLITGALVALLLAAQAGFAFAHDHNHPELNEWYRSLQSRKGPCCGGPDEDATSLNDLQWRTKGKTFEVFVEGGWVDVPEEAIVNVPNVTGTAKVWLYHFNGMPVVRCFMPGMMG
ncbi:hypothetical protein [Bradyrhizobium lablabi]|uniref:hypothetical protein n=1 Tax=Bradyrhizobium lablabi TaxID=722472 RepID=UPI00289F4FC8|nr:hypothetical protein [Bradyrhizobium lablabi]